MPRQGAEVVPYHPSFAAKSRRGREGSARKRTNRADGMGVARRDRRLTGSRSVDDELLCGIDLVVVLVAALHFRVDQAV